MIHLFDNIDACAATSGPRRASRASSPKAARRRTSCPIATVADFYIRYPDEVYLQQVREFVDNAAKAAALATGTKVKIDHYGKRPRRHLVGTLDESASPT